MTTFYDSLRTALQEEANAGSKYVALSKDAPSEDERKTLIEMAKQEIMHKAHLECMLLGHDGK